MEEKKLGFYFDLLMKNDFSLPAGFCFSHTHRFYQRATGSSKRNSREENIQERRKRNLRGRQHAHWCFTGYCIGSLPVECLAHTSIPSYTHAIVLTILSLLSLTLSLSLSPSRVILYRRHCTNTRTRSYVFLVRVFCCALRLNPHRANSLIIVSHHRGGLLY